MAQILNDGELYLSRRELRCLGVSACDMRSIPGPHVALPNPHGYRHTMRGYAWSLIAAYMPTGVMRCGRCYRVHHVDVPCGTDAALAIEEAA